jgi:hypothetical protein
MIIFFLKSSGHSSYCSKQESFCYTLRTGHIAQKVFGRGNRELEADPGHLSIRAHVWTSHDLKERCDDND